MPPPYSSYSLHSSAVDNVSVCGMTQGPLPHPIHAPPILPPAGHCCHESHMKTSGIWRPLSVLQTRGTARHPSPARGCAPLPFPTHHLLPSCSSPSYPIVLLASSFSPQSHHLSLPLIPSYLSDLSPYTLLIPPFFPFPSTPSRSFSLISSLLSLQSSPILPLSTLHPTSFSWSPRLNLDLVKSE